MKRPTMHRRRARRVVLATLAATVLAGTGIGYAAQADADRMACQTDLWGFLGSERRELCDTPRQPDGSWIRSRVIYRPAGWVPVTCYGRYFITCDGGYFRPLQTRSSEFYPVTDATRLPDEPGHIQ